MKSRSIPTVLAFVVGLAIVTGVLFGLLPALRLSKYGEHGHASQSQLSTLARNSRLGHVLATVQLACAMGAPDRRRLAREQLPEAHGHQTPASMRPAS